MPVRAACRKFVDGRGRRTGSTAPVRTPRLLAFGNYATEADVVRFSVRRQFMDCSDGGRLEAEGLLIVKSASTQRFFLTAGSIQAPFPNVAKHVVQSVFICRLSAHRFRSGACGFAAGHSLIKSGVGDK